MSNRYYIGNPRMILTPDACESALDVDSYVCGVDARFNN